MSPIDHNYDKLVHNLVNSPETIDGFRSRNLPYNLRFSILYPVVAVSTQTRCNADL